MPSENRDLLSQRGDPYESPPFSASLSVVRGYLVEGYPTVVNNWDSRSLPPCFVLKGERYLKPAVTETARQNLDRARTAFESSPNPDPLTPRELEVLRLMAGGLSNREIGEVFGTSEATVKSQVSSIISKLGVRDRIRAVLRALEKGWL